MKLFKFSWNASALAIFLAGSMAACVEDDVLSGDNQFMKDGLQLLPKRFCLENGMKTHSEGDNQTRAVPDNITELVNSLREDYMGQKLDVFVVGIDNPTFFNRYSFSESKIEEKYYLMENNWKHVNTTSNNRQYVVGQQYKLYALVNYEGPEITTLEELKNAKAGYRLNTLTNAYECTNDVFKRYATAAPGKYDAFTASKLFTMDGAVDLTFASSESNKQVDVQIKRAASKIVLDLKIDPDFLKKQISENVINAGNPRFRPVSFNYHAYAVDGLADRPALEPLVVTQGMFDIPATEGGVTESTEIENPKREYQLTTYCYPFNWSDDVTEKSPCLIVSVGFNNKFYYYHIPITQADVKELKRNHVYHIDATIVGLGALRAEDEVEKVVNLKYDVIPWAVENDEISIVNVASDLKFLLVDPKFTKMYGDGTESTVINYYAATGAPVKWEIEEVYYYNANNQKITAYGTATNAHPERSTFWKNATASKGEGSTIVVSSEALTNKAVKFIKMRVWLDDDNDGVWDSTEKSEMVTIKHFTQQSLQNISGKWSSRWNGESSTAREYSFNPTADGWDSWDGYEDNISCTKSEYDNAEVDYRNIVTGTRTTTREDFLNNVTSNSDRAAANSEANAVNGYWGTNPSDVSYQNSNPGDASIDDNWDYWDRYWGGYGPYNDYNKHKYNNYYTNSQGYTARRYYREVEGDASTGQWTDYENKTGSRYRGINYAGNTYNSSYGFEAKWTQGDNQQIRYLIANGRDGESDYSLSGLTNNHMYVVQVTEALTDKTIGRPTLNGSYQSSDNVVSPAFMIASQLGAVDSQAFNATRAATHCSSYMEVDNDGTRYTGWRLPTQDEVTFIVDYQNKNWDTIAEVLSGSNYYTLNGGSKATGYSGNGTYVRCVRDLTVEEVNALNDKTE